MLALQGDVPFPKQWLQGLVKTGLPVDQCPVTIECENFEISDPHEAPFFPDSTVVAIVALFMISPAARCYHGYRAKAPRCRLSALLSRSSPHAPLGILPRSVIHPGQPLWRKFLSPI